MHTAVVAEGGAYSVNDGRGGRVRRNLTRRDHPLQLHLPADDLERIRHRLGAQSRKRTIYQGGRRPQPHLVLARFMLPCSNSRTCTSRRSLAPLRMIALGHASDTSP